MFYILKVFLCRAINTRVKYAGYGLYVPYRTHNLETFALVVDCYRTVWFVRTLQNTTLERLL